MSRALYDLGITLAGIGAMVAFVNNQLPAGSLAYWLMVTSCALGWAAFGVSLLGWLRRPH